MSEFIPGILSLVIIVLAIYLGLKMDKNLKTSQPNINPYAFGYFLGVFGVLALPLALLQYAYMPTAGATAPPSLYFEFLLFILSIGIIYRRNLAWIAFILVNLFYVISPIVIPMMKNPFQSFDTYIAQYIVHGEGFTLVLMIIFLIVITIYFLKRRHEMPLI